jgi:hypothetical protein
MTLVLDLAVDVKPLRRERHRRSALDTLYRQQRQTSARGAA